MFDDEVWDWIVDHASGDFDHLLLCTTVPYLLSPGFHDLEAWNERLCDGAWGGLAARGSEKLRRAVDFDHWAAFQFSFQRLRELLEEVGSGKRGKAPASIASSPATSTTPTSATSPSGPGRRSRARSTRRSARPTATRSTARERRRSRPASRSRRAFAHGLARISGAPDPGIRWRLLEGPYFDNQVATLRLDGREATVRLDKTIAGEDESNLEKTFERRLALRAVWGGAPPGKAHPAPRLFRRLQIPLRHRRPDCHGESRPRGRRTMGHHR